VKTRPKDIGTRAETAVVRALWKLGFPHAERRALAGVHDLGDITGTPGVVWEIKGGVQAMDATDGRIRKWLAETAVERANAAAQVGVLVVQRRGVGAPNAKRWWAWMPLGQMLALMGPDYVLSAPLYDTPVRMLLVDACMLLRNAGYGDPLPEEWADHSAPFNKADAELWRDEPYDARKNR